jgi:hypothetical protein
MTHQGDDHGQSDSTRPHRAANWRPQHHHQVIRPRPRHRPGRQRRAAITPAAGAGCWLIRLKTARRIEYGHDHDQGTATAPATTRATAPGRDHAASGDPAEDGPTHRAWPRPRPGRRSHRDLVEHDDSSTTDHGNGNDHDQGDDTGSSIDTGRRSHRDLVEHDDSSTGHTIAPACSARPILTMHIKVCIIKS